MPRVSIRFAESAIADFEAIGDWYADQGACNVGDQMIQQVITRIEALGDHPAMGRIVPEFGQPSLRELIQPPFRIVYRNEPHVVRVVRVVRVWRSERILVLPEEGET